MNKSLLGGLIIGVAVAAGGGAIASFKLHRQPDYAKVLEVTPLTKTISTPRQACHDEAVTRKKQPSDSHQVIATVAGAAAGGYGGNQIERHVQDKNTYTTTEQRCQTVYDKSEKQIGYSVRYRLGNEERTIKMNHDPGDRIPVRDGQLVLDDAAGSKENTGSKDKKT